MKPFLGGSLGATLLAAACASYPAPTQHMADATAAARSAQEIGAGTNPQAQLHLQMAQEEIASAQKLMSAGDNHRADTMLSRAQADADLALQLTKETYAESEARKALDNVRSMQGTTPTGVTTTTSGSVPARPSEEPLPGEKQ
jgi:hypothetical protein